MLYLALGETDDWAHDGRYDRVLETYARTDDYLKQLWTWLQSQPEYRGRTHLLITTDHGRGPHRQGLAGPRQRRRRRERYVDGVRVAVDEPVAWSGPGAAAALLDALKKVFLRQDGGG